MLLFNGNQHQFYKIETNREDLSIKLAKPLKPSVICDQNG